MSIVDVRDHRLHGRIRTVYRTRGKYHKKTHQKVTRVDNTYYVLAATFTFTVLLLCSSAGVFLLSSRLHPRDPSVQNSTSHDNDQVLFIDDPHHACEETSNSPALGESLDDYGPEMTVSPLQQILTADQWEDAEISSDDEYMQLRMQQLATMEESSLIIGETIVPYESREEFNSYLSKQIGASKMISEKQADAILDMVRLKSSDLIFLRAETGMCGSLRNSLTLALCSHKGQNIHFMLVILQVEAHLGWRIIPSGERSSWNRAMKASLELKMRGETKKLLEYGLAENFS